tara:strand:- start:2794 stop:3474 length:681 start_codon:yes stop_codon:yes gene_type:complete
MNSKEQAQIYFAHLGSVEDKIAYGDKQFYMSLLWQHENKTARDLSLSQMHHLERLYNKYSAEELQTRAEFEKNYGESERKIAQKCAQYYANQYPAYYDGIVSKVLKDPDNHILSHNEYNKMCNNKYAKKILACYEQAPKYSVGDFVQIRTQNRIDVANTNQKEGHMPRRSACRTMANKVCMVLEVNALPITRAAKGARIYKILITDETQPIYAHESDLKKARRPRS